MVSHVLMFLWCFYRKGPSSPILPSTQPSPRDFPLLVLGNPTLHQQGPGTQKLELFKEKPWGWNSPRALTPADGEQMMNTFVTVPSIQVPMLGLAGKTQEDWLRREILAKK